MHAKYGLYSPHSLNSREKPMRPNLPALIALSLSIAGCSKPAVTTYVPDLQYDYSGEWTLKWVESDSRHPVSLMQQEHKLLGMYTSADDLPCSVSGTHTSKPAITLQIDCPNWQASLHGIVTQKGSAVTGTYTSEGNTGTFSLLKHRLPPVADSAATGKK
jgi:hypothetical protein